MTIKKYERFARAPQRGLRLRLPPHFHDVFPYDLSGKGERVGPEHTSGVNGRINTGVDIVANGWNMFFAPAALPSGQVKRLAGAIQAVMKTPEMQKRFLDAKLTPVVSSPEQSTAMLKAYRAQWAPVVQRSGYQP